MTAYCVPCNGPDSLHRLAPDPDSYPSRVDTGIWAVNDNSFFFPEKKTCILQDHALKIIELIGKIGLG